MQCHSMNKLNGSTGSVSNSPSLLNIWARISSKILFSLQFKESLLRVDHLPRCRTSDCRKRVALSAKGDG